MKPGTKKLQPLINVDPSNIGDPSLLELFKKIQLVWEKAYKSQKTGFNIRSKKFSSFRKKYGLNIIVELQDNVETRAAREGFFDHQKAQNIFIFTSSKSQAYDLLRHLRNAVAHATFEKKKVGAGDYLIVSDAYRKKYTMLGKIKLSLMSQFIESLYATRKR